MSQYLTLPRNQRDFLKCNSEVLFFCHPKSKGNDGLAHPSFFPSAVKKTLEPSLEEDGKQKSEVLYSNKIIKI